MCIATLRPSVSSKRVLRSDTNETRCIPLCDNDIRQAIAVDISNSHLARAIEIASDESEGELIC